MWKKEVPCRRKKNPHGMKTQSNKPRMYSEAVSARETLMKFNI